MPDALVRFLITFAVLFLAISWANRLGLPAWQRALIGGVVMAVLFITEQVLRETLR